MCVSADILFQAQQTYHNVIETKESNGFVSALSTPSSNFLHASLFLQTENISFSLSYECDECNIAQESGPCHQITVHREAPPTMKSYSSIDLRLSEREGGREKQLRDTRLVESPHTCVMLHHIRDEDNG